MISSTSRLNAHAARLATLLGSASLLTIANAIADNDRAYAGEVVAQAVPEEIPENVLITGSLIRGTVAVGVPVVNLSPMDFATTGSLTTADLFKNFPAANVNGGEVGTESGARISRGAKVNLRGLDTGDAVRSLMLVDGMRFPPQSEGLCAIDPSVIPSISLDHVDILVDGASATYGSDAISGVVNLILRRNYDGAQTQLRYTDRVGGGARYQVGQLWGRTWDGGQITLSYEWYEEVPTKANALSNFNIDHSPWGYDDRRLISSSVPGTISRAPFPTSAQQLGTQCGYNTGVSPNTASSCFAIPLGSGQNFRSDLNSGIGPLTPGSASTLNWATLSTDTNFAGPLNPSAGTRNIRNPYSQTWYDAVEQRNGGAMTVDQRLTKDISFYGSAFYSNRRAKFLGPGPLQPTANNAISLVAVPTFNPYYPSNAPTNLRVSYDLSIEAPGLINGYEVAARYQAGLNIALPAGWESQIFYSETYDSSFNHVSYTANKAAISAALGWTIAPVAPSGSAPSFGTWTKPAAVPYLNVFCDPYAYQCNSGNTLNYISGYRSVNERFWINEKGFKADGPLFDLPGGTVKMAVGGDLSSYRFNSISQDNSGGPNLTINPQYDPEGRFVWATFAQINLPIFGDNNAIFGFRKLEFEASWRHDQYSDVGGTSNPKIAFNWTPFDDLTIKGAWGSNFRAPVFGEFSPVANVNIQGWNLGGQLANGSNVISTCSGVNNPLPSAASGAGKLQTAGNSFNNAMAAAGVAGYTATSGCVSALAIPDPVAPYVDSAGNSFTAFADVTNLLQPGGTSTLGGSQQAIPIRQFTRNGLVLRPELATNWGIGFDYAPTNILRGLDIQATYYIIKINGVLRSFGNPNDGQFANGQIPFAWPTPSDIGCPTLPNSLVPSIPIPANLVPSACPQWMQAVGGLMANPRAQVSPQAQTLVYWINDGSVFNQGWAKLDGIDWNFSYDWDMGNIGAFNAGAQGTYYLHNKSETSPGAPGSVITDGFHTTVGSGNAESHGVATLPYLRYRGRFGWSNGPWNVTGFVDYTSHYYHTQSAPPNVNGNFCTSTQFGAPAGGTFPCAQNGYSNGQPAWYTFDLSVGYDTGEDPVNDYLKNIGIQAIIQNILDKRSDYQYKGTNTAGSGCTCNPLHADYGRQVSLIITKTW